MNIYKQTESDKGKLTIYYDEDAPNPRTEWDNFGTMACYHSRYLLGDKDVPSMDEVNELIKSDDVISIPIYLYDHSGLTIATHPFSCPWDSGQIGYIYVTKDQIRKEYSCKRITKKIMDRALSVLQCEVEVYDQYLTGQCFGFELEKTDGTEDSCWGFLGDTKEVIAAMKDHVSADYAELFAQVA